MNSRSFYFLSIFIFLLSNITFSSYGTEGRSTATPRQQGRSTATLRQLRSAQRNLAVAQRNAVARQQVPIQAGLLIQEPGIQAQATVDINGNPSASLMVNPLELDINGLKCSFYSFCNSLKPYTPPVQKPYYSDNETKERSAWFNIQTLLKSIMHIKEANSLTSCHKLF